MTNTVRDVVVAALHNYGLFAANVVQATRNAPTEKDAADVREFYRKCLELGPQAEGLAKTIEKGDYLLVPVGAIKSMSGMAEVLRSEAERLLAPSAPEAGRDDHA